MDIAGFRGGGVVKACLDSLGFDFQIDRVLFIKGLPYRLFFVRQLRNFWDKCWKGDETLIQRFLELYGSESWECNMYSRQFETGRIIQAKLCYQETISP